MSKNHFFKKYSHDVKAICFIGLGLFFTLALISYSPRDPSLNSIGHSLKNLNYCGLTGSYLSDLIYQAFGLPAWVGIAGLFQAAFISFRGKNLEIKSIRLIWMSILILSLSALVAVYWPTTKLFENQIYPGGLVGLGLSSVLVKVFSTMGTQVFLWSIAAVMFVFSFDVSLRELLSGPVDFMFEKIRSIVNIKDAKVFKNWKWPELHFISEDKPMEKIVEKKEKAMVKESPLVTASLQKPIETKEEDLAPEQLDFDEEVTVSTYETPERKKIVAPVKTPRKVANWSMPKLSLLEDPPLTRIKIDEKEIRKKADITLEKLKQFDVNGQIVAAKPGPVVTMFEFKPNADVRVNKVTELADDLSLALSAESLRVIAPIPGRDVIGIETSNATRETVYLKDLLADEDFWSEDVKLPIALGKQANGEPKIVDLRKMPHLLIAGTTGSGKSVFTVSTITGFLFKHSPKTLRMILVDPKQVDLAAFSDLPHLIMPPIREPKKAVFALRWAVKEMEKRYKSMSKFGARNIEQFNEAVEKLNAGEAQEHEKTNADLEAQGGIAKLEQYYFTSQPYIVIVVEEFGDLMAVDKQNVEQNIVRLAQMARACGIHLMLAMQSPRKEVVTGLIKTNIPGRISFKVASKMDSRIILDEQGAERLLSQGDMLSITGGTAKPVRHHGPFLKESEINAIAKFWSDQAEPEYDPIAMRALEGAPSGAVSAGGDTDFAGDLSGDDEYDEKYDEILSWAATQKAISASLIQRRFKLGYPRAARLIEIFEREGVVGPANGSKPRQVLVNSHEG